MFTANSIGLHNKNRQLLATVAQKMRSVSQDSVATRLRCGGIFNDAVFEFTAECDGENILKIDQQWVKL